MAEREEEKSQRTILLDDIGSQDLPPLLPGGHGLPELARKSLGRERENSVDSPSKMKKEHE